MKIISRLSFLILIPIIVGLALVLSGNNAGSLVLAIGIPGTFLALLLLWFILPDSKKEKGIYHDELSEQDQIASRNIKESKYTQSNNVEQSKKGKEQLALNEINEARNVAEAMKHASPKGIAIGLIFFFLLVLDAILGTVFVIKHIFVGGIICAVAFAVAVITILTTALIREKKYKQSKKIVVGQVKSCFMSSMGSMKSGSTGRVAQVVYTVIITSDGVDYTASSKLFYKSGDSVVIAIMSRKSAKIVDINNLENQNDN